jgi:multicomponent Na+:H+ antiporter subunit C
VEPVFAIVFGVMVAVATYLLMSRNALRIVLGLLVLGNAANLSIFVAGRLGSRTPPLVPDGEAFVTGVANPLPQALILTAIVISFALVAFTVVLFQSAYKQLGTIDADAMRVAEPEDSGDTSTKASQQKVAELAA